MLSVELITREGEVLCPRNALSVSLRADLNVPADSLELLFPYSERLDRDISGVRVLLDGKTVFNGQPDELIRQRSSGGVTLKLTARNLAALLLDNEAEPLCYHEPSAAFIAEKHLIPFGITEYSGAKTPFYGDMRIDKGMSHWQVLERFCVCRYGAAPRITGDGRAILDGRSEEGTVSFGDGGIMYTELRECRDRSRLISQVRLRVNPQDGYNAELSNPNPDCLGITRVRYVNVRAEDTTLATADRIIENGNRKSWSLRLSCPGCRLDALGKSASVSDALFGSFDGLRVRSVFYRSDVRGERTVIQLEREEF